MTLSVGEQAARVFLSPIVLRHSHPMSQELIPNISNPIIALDLVVTFQRLCSSVNERRRRYQLQRWDQPDGRLFAHSEALPLLLAR